MPRSQQTKSLERIQSELWQLGYACKSLEESNRSLEETIDDLAKAVDQLMQSIDELAEATKNAPE